MSRGVVKYHPMRSIPTCGDKIFAGFGERCLRLTHTLELNVWSPGIATYCDIVLSRHLESPTCGGKFPTCEEGRI